MIAASEAFKNCWMQKKSKKRGKYKKVQDEHI